MTDMVTRRRYR